MSKSNTKLCLIKSISMSISTLCQIAIAVHSTLRFGAKVDLKQNTQLIPSSWLQ